MKDRKSSSAALGYKPIEITHCLSHGKTTPLCTNPILISVITQGKKTPAETQLQLSKGPCKLYLMLTVPLIPSVIISYGP